MRTLYIVGGLFLATGCGTSSNPVQGPAVPPVQPATTTEIVEAPPIEVPPPVIEEPGKVIDVSLRTAVNSNDEKFTLGKRCTFIDDKCDPSTITLTLDGKVLSFRAKNSKPAAPFGQWEKMRVFNSSSGNESMYLSLQHESEFEHLRFEIDNGVLNETGSERFPTTISKTIPNTIDFNEDGKPDILRFTCDAALLSSERPTACGGGFNLWLDERKVHTDKNTYAETDGIVVTPFTHNSVHAIRIASQQDEEGWIPPTLTTILVAKAGVMEIGFTDTVFGKVTWKDNGSFAVEESVCDKPARLKYSENGDAKVLAFGKERYRTRKYTWDGRTITDMVPKRWKTRRSKCQTEGRCPYVYAGKSDTKLGEILRNLVGTKRWKNQYLEIPRDLVEEGHLSIKIAEEKVGEVTHIDSVWLMVGDTRILPRDCPNGLCSKDTNTMSLGLGDSIRLEFDKVPSGGEIRLFANGYYLYQ